jgi:hypothetical protein
MWRAVRRVRTRARDGPDKATSGPEIRLPGDPETQSGHIVGLCVYQSIY